jgi:hypothetical protein
VSLVYPVVTAWHHAVVLPNAAYLRVYEPLSAFPGADRRRWAAYAASADRPRRAGALEAEHAGALRRLLADPPVAAPEWESGDAYVRWAEGVTYLCPWQTQLRAWLGLARLKATSPGLWSSAFPAGAADSAVSGFARYRGQVPSLRVYIQGSTWSVPVAWFVPFASDERWLVLGAASDPGEGGRATASATRALVYATTMSRARQRVAWALAAVRGVGGMPTAGPVGQPRPDQAALRGLQELEQIGCWLAEFHPQGLVELDYGGLVHLLDDQALRADQSAAEASAAMGALARGELEMATAMYRRLTRRWGVLAALEQAS